MIEHYESVKAEAQHLENKLKAINPTYAEITADNDMDFLRAVWQRKNQSIPWRNYMMYFILITSLTLCFTSAKYISKVEGSSDATVAKFDVSVEKNSPLIVEQGGGVEPSALLFEGQNPKTIEDAFTVTNESEVAVLVVPTVTNNENFNVKFYCSGVEIPATGLELSPSNDGTNDTANIDISISPKSMSETVTNSMTIKLTTLQKD